MRISNCSNSNNKLTACCCRHGALPSQVEVEDWDTGEAVLLTLDPTKTPVERSALLYKKARKMRRAADAVQPLMEAVEADLGYLEEVEAAVQQLKQQTEPEDIKALKVRPSLDRKWRLSND